MKYMPIKDISVKDISVVIPAYNEEKRIKSTIKKIQDFLKGYSYEIIVVDDCSRDSTAKIINYMITRDKRIKLLRNEKNKGKGYSVKKGIINATKDYVLFSDADLSTPIEELEKIRKYLPEYDIVIASRNLTESKIPIKQPVIRRTLGRIFPLMVRLVAVRGIKDTQCGFKLFKAKVAKELFQKMTINKFCFDVEVLYIAQKHGYKIKEVPITWRNAEGSKVRVLKDAFNMLVDLFIILFNDKIKNIYRR